MKVTPSVLALSIIPLAASVGKAQPFESNTNYFMGNPSCSPTMQNVKVTVQVTEALISHSTCIIKSGSTSVTHKGFSLQLNANAPSAVSGAQSAWQQYVIEVDQSNITAHTQLWSAAPMLGTGGDSSVPVPSAGTIPAGYTLIWNLSTNASGYVTGVTYSIKDENGNALSGTPLSFSIPKPNQAPIAALTLDMVGYSNGCDATFASGAGSITYSTSTSPATDFTAEGAGIPSCAVTTLAGGRGGASTGETSTNGIYELLKTGASSTKIVQEFTTQDTVTASIQAPAAGAKVPEGVAIPLEASAIDQGSGNLLGTALDCKSITWTSSDPGATFSHSATGCSLLVTFSSTLGGQTVTATATDAFGVTGESTVAVDVVARPAGPVPEAFPLTLGFAGNTAVLRGVVSGGTGTVTAVWTDSSGAVIGTAESFAAGTAVTLTPVDTTYINGTETVTLKATDSAGHTNKTTLEITGVSPPT
jgi:hypothetical protein